MCDMCVCAIPTPPAGGFCKRLPEALEDATLEARPDLGLWFQPPGGFPLEGFSGLLSGVPKFLGRCALFPLFSGLDPWFVASKGLKRRAVGTPPSVSGGLGENNLGLWWWFRKVVAFYRAASQNCSWRFRASMGVARWYEWYDLRIGFDAAFYSILDGKVQKGGMQAPSECSTCS